MNNNNISSSSSSSGKKGGNDHEDLRSPAPQQQRSKEGSSVSDSSNANQPPAGQRTPHPQTNNKSGHRGSTSSSSSPRPTTGTSAWARSTPRNLTTASTARTSPSANQRLAAGVGTGQCRSTGDPPRAATMAGGGHSPSRKPKSSGYGGGGSQRKQTTPNKAKSSSSSYIPTPRRTPPRSNNFGVNNSDGTSSSPSSTSNNKTPNKEANMLSSPDSKDSAHHASPDTTAKDGNNSNMKNGSSCCSSNNNKKNAKDEIYAENKNSSTSIPQASSSCCSKTKKSFTLNDLEKHDLLPSSSSIAANNDTTPGPNDDDDVLLLQEEPSNNKVYCCMCGDACTCGDDCMCSEELCQCTAYQVLHSLGSPPPTTKKRMTAIISPTKGAATISSKPKEQQHHDNRTNTAGTTTATDPLAAGGGNRGDGDNDDDDEYYAEFNIAGMTCSMCSQSVERAVGALNGILQVEISLATDTALIAWQPTVVTAEDITDAIEAVGYDVEHVVPIQQQRYEGVDDEQIEERWERYRQRQNSKVGQRRLAFLWALVGTIPIFLLSMFLSHMAFASKVLHRHVSVFHLTTMDLEALLLWILATPVQFICGWEFYKMAWHGFRTGKAGMDVLVALGTSASYGYALFGAWRGDDHAAHFFETSAVLVAFVLAGKWMQAAAVRRTSEALTQLMELQSPTAVKVTPLHESEVFDPLKDPYTEAIVETKEVKVGDLVKVIRGASIPADGLVMFGEMSVDESMVTGESVPILKTRGAVVLGGTICVETGGTEIPADPSNAMRQTAVGAAFVSVTGVGSKTALAQIVQLVQDAQTRSVPIQSFADQVSAIFVPVVCTISLLTYLTWYALCSSNAVPEAWYRVDHGEDAATFSLMFAIACLVISCPCALGLATPTAVMVGTGVGAKAGVLIKGGEALETASKVDSVVFDKTGTLTKGKPVVTDFIRLDGGEKSDQSSTDYYLWLLGSLERNSEHPLARAIVAHAEEELGDALEEKPFVQPTEFRGSTGRGCCGVILEKISVAVGNRSFASMRQLEIPPQVDASMKTLEEDGKTAILAAINGQICIVLGIADELKSDAAASISYLQEEMGIAVWMVTGDNSRTAAAISRQLHLPPEQVISEALPAAKLEKVSLLRAEGRVVAMVGDGVNDSPALAEADVGISLGTGAEIATEASDMVLVRGHVADVCTALHLSRVIFRRIQWNLLWSLVYNCLGIPIAAGAFYPFFHSRLHPTVAAIAMALSSVSVVLSSLALRLYKPPAVEGRVRHRSTTLWARAMSSREELVNDQMRANLLSHDHLASSELTEIIDNRTVRRLEEGAQ